MMPFAFIKIDVNGANSIDISTKNLLIFFFYFRYRGECIDDDGDDTGILTWDDMMILNKESI